MAEQKTYISSKTQKMIHPGRRSVLQERAGELVEVERPAETVIQFQNGRYTTGDPEEQEMIEEHPDFRGNGGDDHIHLRGDDQALEEEAGGPSLEERFQQAESADEVAQLLDEAGVPVPDELGEGETDSEAESDPEAESDDPGELEVIESVSNKAEALAALQSISGLSVEVTTNNTVGEIAEWAEEQGYTFAGWPNQ
jgi:hypothetical protein